MKTVEFQFDFGSPNAYLAHRVIPNIEARTGARFIYTPVLLGGLFKLTNNQSPMMAFAGIPNKMAYENLEMRRFVARHDIPFQMNPHFPVNTLLLMRMATAAVIEGGLRAYVDAAYRLMWETPKKMDDPQIVATELTAAGIDADRLMRRAQEADVKQRLMATTEDAAKRGAFGSPTFFLEGDMYFGKNTLPEIENQLAN
ncbi:MAG: disulfide bond formation protein DsbA [Alphaproteobacteria bacterium HGW-Alphaproteobacteria-18]|nr:MAG: disulfide bond formation protein DsbA [Alphaproteobacteria bacterium HGW-Alphaproteobacteria-18]